MISLSHWGMFEQLGPVYLLPCTDDQPFEIKPGSIYRIHPDALKGCIVVQHGLIQKAY